MDHELPEGRYIELPGRGTTFVREGGDPSAPTVLLLHGWTANADLNWREAYGELTARFHVLAPDHRGHGRGIRDTGPFRLEDCADDAVALLDVLGIATATVVGYSMGGPIAQLLWKRHRSRVEALVLCATSCTFNGTARERALFGLLSGATVTARHLDPSRRAALAMRLMHRPHFESHDWLAVLDAGRQLGRYDSRWWIHRVDVPTSVVVTTRDRVVPSQRQYELAASIRGATVHEVDGDHAVCLADADRFVPALVRAIDDVFARAGRALIAA